jgi:hypothetical protein
MHAIDRAFMRLEFTRARYNRDKTYELLNMVEPKIIATPGKFPPVVIAYYGALKGLEAKFTFNPAQKLHLISQSLSLLDQAVKKGKDDLEVRFVRFASLHYLPPLFGIGKKRGEDIGAICALLEKREYHTVDHKMQLDMVNLMLKSKRLSKSQQKALQAIQTELSQQ